MEGIHLDIPRAPASFRSGSLLVLAYDGDMFARAITSGKRIWKPNMPWAKFLGKLPDSSDVYAISHRPKYSVSIRFGPRLPRASDGNMSGGQDDVGGHYWKPNSACAEFRGGKRPNLGAIMLFSASARFRPP